MYCPQCGSNVADDAKFCNQCGTQLAPSQRNIASQTVPLPGSSTAASNQPVPAPEIPQAPTPASARSAAMPNTAPNQGAPATPAAFQPTAGPSAPVASNPTQQVPVPGPAIPAMPQPQFAQAGAQPAVPPQMPPKQVQKPVQPIDMEGLARSGGAGLGIGVASAFVVSIVTAILALAVSSSALSQISDDSGPFGSILSSSLLGGSQDMNILQSILFFMIQGVAGGFSISYQGDGLFSFSSEASVWQGAGFSGFALLLGVAFGVYLFGRKNTIRFRWMGIATAAVVGVAAGIVYELLALIGRFQVSRVTVSGTTVRTFFMAFLFAAGGALIGYALAQITPDASNVFSAMHLWFQRARGFVRTFAETLLLFSIVSLAIALVLYVIVAIHANEAASILLFPAALPLIAGQLFSLGSLGAVAEYGEADGTSYGLLGGSGNLSSMSGSGWLWLYVLVVVIAVLYLGLREAARNMYDPAYAGWQHSWKAPLTAGLFWLVYSYAALSSGSESSFVMPALWSCLIVAFWSFLVEVVALTFGPSIIVSVPGLWKFIVGGTVKPTPQEVLDYNRAMNQHSSVPAVPATAVPGNGSPSVPSPAAPVEPRNNGQSATTGNDSQTFHMAAPAAAPATPPVPGVPGAAAAQPMSSNTKKTMMIIGIVIGVLVVLAVVIGALSSTVFNPKNAANKYLSQLSSGDYDAASKTVDPGIDTNMRALLTSAVSANGKNALSSPKVDSVSVNGTEATAQIEYSVHGTTTKDTLSLHKDGNTMLFFPKWVVSKPLLSSIVVEDSGAVKTVLVNNVKVSKTNADSSSSSGSLKFAVYPGTYTVSLPKSDYITASSVTTYVMGGSSTSTAVAQIKVTATDKLVSAVNDAIKTKMGECGKVTDPTSEDCLLNEQLYNTDDQRNMSWTVTKLPTITAKDISITDSGIEFSTGYGDGKATLSYEEQDWFDENTWTPETEDYSFGLSGSVTIDNGKPDIKFEDAD